MLLRATSAEMDRAERIHIMGIGGTAMGTFAGMLAARGRTVLGSDAGCYPPMSDLLAGWGIEVLEGYRAENLNWGPDLVIVGNVIRRTNPEAVAMRELGLAHTSFPEAFSHLFLKDRHPIVVTGTHGKTTTTSLTAWLLEHGGLAPGLLVGGVPLNFGSSFRLGEGAHFVVEGDEYDTAYFDKVPKFVHYRPQTGIITNIEFDHADIYPNVEAIEAEFEGFARLISTDGRLIACIECPRTLRIAESASCEVEFYGIEDPRCAWSAANVQENAQGTQFNLVRVQRALGRFQSPLFGRHNLLNSVAALAASIGSGLSLAAASSGLAMFQNVKKRHEIKGVVDNITVIDDFAHHPTAVRETVRAVRNRYPKARLWCCFEVESNTSRRRIFQDAYPPAFTGAHAVIFCKPLEKEDNLAPDERLSLPEVVDEIRNMGIESHIIEDVNDIVEWLTPRLEPGDVVLGMSGRHFYGLHDKVVRSLIEQSGGD